MLNACGMGRKTGISHAKIEGKKGGEVSMDWIVYVVVGIAVGMNLGYMIGIRRGAAIVAGLLSGIGNALEAVGSVVDKKE